MLNSKEKRANLIALIVATLLLIGGPYNWLSQNLSTGATVRIVLNFLTYLITAVLVWWGVQNFNRTRPRQFWETGFRWWSIVFVYGYLVASSEWWIFLSCLPLPLTIWLFYFSTDRMPPTWTPWQYLPPRGQIPAPESTPCTQTCRLCIRRWDMFSNKGSRSARMLSPLDRDVVTQHYTSVTSVPPRDRSAQRWKAAASIVSSLYLAATVRFDRQPRLGRSPRVSVVLVDLRDCGCAVAGDNGHDHASVAVTGRPAQPMAEAASPRHRRHRLPGSVLIGSSAVTDRR